MVFVRAIYAEGAPLFRVLSERVGGDTACTILRVISVRPGTSLALRSVTDPLV
jgi:hypothetical protein